MCLQYKVPLHQLTLHSVLPPFESIESWKLVELDPRSKPLVANRRLDHLGNWQVEPDEA